MLKVIRLKALHIVVAAHRPLVGEGATNTIRIYEVPKFKAQHKTLNANALGPNDPCKVSS